MSVSFKRLSEGFASLDSSQAKAAPADIRHLKQWLDNLPRANPKETANLLKSALFGSLALKMDGATRFNQLELMRPSVIEAVIWLERQYLSSSLPLIHNRFAYSVLAQQLDLALADGYRLSCAELCSPSGTIPMLKSAAVTTALIRSAWHYQQVLKQSWKLYRPCPDSVWLGLHRVYRFALSLNLANKECEDPTIGHSICVQHIYVATALMSLMNPLTFAQVEQDQIKSLATGFAPRCSIQNSQPNVYFAKIPIDADLPVDCDLPEDDVAYLEYGAFFEALEQATYIDLNELVEIEVSKSMRQSVHVSIRKRALRALGLASARIFPRIYAQYPIETVAGLSVIHFFSAGRLDFENFTQNIPQIGSQGLSMLADWLSMGSEVNTQKFQTAQVLDHSLAGYRLQWQAEQVSRAKVGELIGIRLAGVAEQQDLMVAIIRWLRYERDGSMTAGLKLLSRRCHAVAVRLIKDGQAGQLQRGLELEALSAGLPRQYLISGRLQGRAQILEVMYSSEHSLADRKRETESVYAVTQSLISNMDYSILTEQT